MADADEEEDATEEVEPPVTITLEQIQIRAALRDEERKEELFQAELRRIEASITPTHTGALTPQSHRLLKRITVRAPSPLGNVNNSPFSLASQRRT